ncbi:MAG TPA: MFS transporter [Candidatus Acidoferrales bacterium]|nr:MFS transporter [Candidatus Acidoferrales bacterium]
MDQHTHVHSHAHGARALTLISLAHGINHAQGALKPLVYPLVLRELGFGYSELGILLGIASAVGGSLQIVAGGLARIVPRHLLLGLGNASVGVFFVLVALAQSFFQFSLWTVLSRIGGAVQHPVGSSLLSHHFQHARLGSALATHFTAGNLGTAAIPFIAALMIGLWGWRVTTILFAVPAILVGIAMCLKLHDPRPSVHTGASSTASFFQDSCDALRNPGLRWILLSTAVAAGGSGHGIISSFLPLYLSHSLGMNAPAVGFIFTLLMLGSVIGPMLGGWLADQYSARRVILGGLALAALSTITLPSVAANPWLLPVIAFVLGIGAFGVHPILQTLLAEITDDHLRDIAFALFYTATFLAGAVWSPAVGYLADRFGLESTFAAMAASFVAASLCILLARFGEASVLRAAARGPGLNA